MLIYPNHPDFYPILYGHIPPTCSYGTFGVDAQTGLLRPLTPEEVEDYVLGGEMEEALSNQPMDEDEEECLLLI
jgi:hypothetical protein